MSNRELVIDLVSKLPEDTPLEDIIHQLAFIAGVNEAIVQSDREEGISAEELRQLMKTWISKSSS